MTKYDIKYIIKKILIYSGVALILMFVKSCDIKADTIKTGTIGINLYRIAQGSTILCNSSNGNCNNITITDNGGPTTGSIYFYNRSYFGLQNQTLIFNGTLEGIGPNMTYMTIGLANGSGQYIGACDTTTSTNGTTVSWTSKCKIYDSALGTTNYSNILQFNFGDQVKNNGHSINIYLSENYILYDTQDISSVNSNVNDIKESINNDNVDNQQSGDFFNNFGSTTNQGLQDLIKKPIDIVDSFYNTCSPIEFEIPYFDTTINLPCISSIQNDFTSVIFPIIRVIINGLLCYRILTKFIEEINKLKDPNNSDLEVVDL